MPPVSRPRAPMFSFALALSVGILLGHLCGTPDLWIGIVAVIFVTCTALVLSRNPRLAWCIAHLAVVALGWFSFTGQAENNLAVLRAADLGSFLDGHQVTLTAHVTRESGAFAASKDHIQVDVESEDLADDMQHRQITAGIRLSLYRRYSEVEYDSDSDVLRTIPSLRYGDRVRVIVKLRPPKNFRNPGALDLDGTNVTAATVMK